MQIEFTQDEAAILKVLVEERIKALGPEIHHTDKRDYKHGLERTREKLSKLLKQLEVTSAA